MSTMPKNLKTQIFNLVEQNKTEELIQFIEKHHDYIANLLAPNYWTLAMYSVRYSNHELMRYLHTKNLLIEHPQAQYTLLSTAFLNNDYDSFKLLNDEFGKDINKPVHQFQEQTFFQYALKFNNNPELLEVLCSRGAYFIIERSNGDQFLNNLKMEVDSNGVKYKSLFDNKEVNISAIAILKKDKSTAAHYFRFKNILLLAYLIQVKSHQIPVGYQDFSSNLNKILEYTVPKNILEI